MSRGWNDFTNLHGNIEGARGAFEIACETLFRAVYKGENVQQVAPKQGDGGIDVFGGNYGIDPIIVIQCKYFIHEIGYSQHQQITDSFTRAIENTEFKTKEWILCIPRVMNQSEHKWFNKWKADKQTEYILSDTFIQLKNGNELIDLMKEHDLYNQIFQIEAMLLANDTNKKVNEIHEAMFPKKELQNTNYKNEHVLFIKYTKEHEPFYYKREEDEIIDAALNISNVWISGASGLSKTNLLTRSVIIKNFEPISCDLSPIIINGSNDIFDEIISTIRSKYSNINTSKVDTNINRIKELTELLNLLLTNFQNIALCIDELSIDNEQIFNEFVDRINRLTIYWTNNSKQCSTIKFIISTITNPKSFCQNINKAEEYFNYIHLERWSDIEIEGLFLIIKKALKLELESNFEIQIIHQCQGNPRLLKNIIKKIISFDGVPGWSTQKAIANAINDHV